MSFSCCSLYSWSHLLLCFFARRRYQSIFRSLIMKYCSMGMPDGLQQGYARTYPFQLSILNKGRIFRNYIKFVRSDTPSPFKYDIMIGDIREVLFRPFRAREGCAAESAWEQRRNGTNRRLRHVTIPDKSSRGVRSVSTHTRNTRTYGPRHVMHAGAVYTFFPGSIRWRMK